MTKTDTTRRTHREALTLIGVLLAVALLITPIRHRIDRVEHPAPAVILTADAK